MNEQLQPLLKLIPNRARNHSSKAEAETNEPVQARPPLLVSYKTEE